MTQLGSFLPLAFLPLNMWQEVRLLLSTALQPGSAVWTPSLFLWLYGKGLSAEGRGVGVGAVGTLSDL